MHFCVTIATGVAECMHFYVIPVTWVAQCMHFYVICWAPLGSVYRVFGPFKNVVKTVKNLKKWQKTTFGCRVVAPFRCTGAIFVAI